MPNFLKTYNFALLEKGDFSYGWCFVVKTPLELLYYIEDIFNNKICNAFQDSMESHLNNTHTKNRLSEVASELSRIKEVSIADAFTGLTLSFYNGALRTLKDYKVIYFNRAGGYFPKDRRIKIKDTLELSEFNWPVEAKKLTLKDMKIATWPNGRHWYVTSPEGKIIPDGDLTKFNTYEYAETVAKNYIEKVNKKLK